MGRLGSGRCSCRRMPLRSRAWERPVKPSASVRRRETGWPEDTSTALSVGNNPAVFHVMSSWAGLTVNELKH
jgi:hypothetical protein